MATKMTKEVKAVISNEFKSCETWEELKTVYVKYASCVETKEQEKLIDKLFNDCAPAVKNIHKAMSTGKVYTKDNGETTDSIKEMVEAILGIEGASLEVNGTWYAVWGTKKENKEETAKILKSYGFWWSKDKQCWRKSPKGYRKSWKHKKMSMDDIRQKYGSTRINSAEEVGA